jgi:hypothetical protein
MVATFVNILKLTFKRQMGLMVATFQDSMKGKGSLVAGIRLGVRRKSV